MGYAASVQNVSVNVKGLEREYVNGADRDTVTFGVLGRELRVSKTIVSLPSAASQGMVCVDGVGMSNTDTEPLGTPAREFKAFFALAGQCEIEVVGLKRSLYFLPGRSKEVMSGSS
jgi:hypothetical protein